MPASDITLIIAAIGGLITAIAGAFALWQRARTPTDRVRQLLQRLRDWLEQANWPVDPNDSLINHLPKSLRRDLDSALDIGEVHDGDE